MVARGDTREALPGAHSVRPLRQREGGRQSDQRRARAADAEEKGRDQTRGAETSSHDCAVA